MVAYTVFDIDWQIDEDYLKDFVSFEKTQARKLLSILFSIPIEAVRKWTKEDMSERLYWSRRHGMISSELEKKYFHVPDKAVIPVSVLNEVVNLGNNTEPITEYLEEKYGFYIDSYKLGKNIKSYINWKEAV